MQKSHNCLQNNPFYYVKIEGFSFSPIFAIGNAQPIPRVSRRKKESLKFIRL